MNTWFLKRLSGLAVLALALAGGAGTLQAAVKVGDALPDLGSLGLEGRLPDGLKGKVVLLDFWASWCGPCKLSFPVLEDLHRRYAERGLVVLGVNVDEKSAAMEAFLKKHTVTFPVVRDAQQKLVSQVDVSTMPTSLLIDGEGKVRYLHSGFHGDASRKEYEKEIELLLGAAAGGAKH